MDAAQIIEVAPGERDFFTCDAIDDAIRLAGVFQGAVERGAVHRTIEISQMLGPFADEGANLIAARQREREAPEALGAVDRMEHPRPADIRRVALRFQGAVDGDQVRQV